jgi:hypothetical protein
MVHVSIVLIFFLVSIRAAIIVGLSILLALLFAFIILHPHDVAANLLSRGAIDFGITIPRGHCCRIPANLCSQLSIRKAVSSHGRDHVIGIGWRTDTHPHIGSGPGLLVVQKRSTRKAKPCL